MSQSAAEMIPAPQTLKLKVGARGPAFDPVALAKAEAAIKSLSGNFAAWLQDEIAKVEAARQRIREEGATPDAIDNLYVHAHDLKGLGSTYEFPIVTRIAGTLCALLDEKEIRLEPPLALVDAHIDAIRAAVRGDIRDDTHPVGKALATELESQVGRLVARVTAARAA